MFPIPLVKIISLVILIFHSTESRYLESWSKVENFTHQNVLNFVHTYENDLTTIIDSGDLSDKCRSSLVDYKNGLLNFDLTSVKRLDSSGKWPSGILSGTFTDLGSYDSCLELESSQYCLLYTNVLLFNETGYEGFMRPYDQQRFNFSTGPLIYFSKYIHLLRHLNITTGLCVPEDCSREELRFIVGKFYDKYNTGFTADVDLCYSKSKTIQWRPSEAIGFTIIVLVILLNLIGSRSSEGSIFSAFNWTENKRKLFTTDDLSTFSFLDGLKALSMLLLIISHFQLGNMYPLYSGFFRALKVATDPPAIPFYLAPINADIFFLISGLLMSYYFFSGKRRLNLIPYIFGRWIRFATLLGWIICLQFVLFGEHFRSFYGGPMWGDYNAIGSIVEACEKTWLSTLLLYQFWFDSSDNLNVCLLFDWYVDIDFVLGILFLLILIPYMRNHKKLSLMIIAALIAAGTAINGLIIHFSAIPTSWISTNFQRKIFTKFMFALILKPWPHISPYFIGVIYGYKLSNPKLKLSKTSLIIGWILCLSCFSVNIIYEYIVNRFGYDPDYPIALAYGIFSRTFWTSGWAWIILILKLDYAPSVSNFLSHPMFRILSRINLSLYCTNFLILRLHNGSARTLIDTTYRSVFIYNYLPLLIIIYLLSLIFTLMIEFPTVNLLKFILNQQSTKIISNKVK